MPKLIWERAGGGRETFGSEETEITIGRDPANTITIESPYVSRHHAVLRLTGTHYTVSDAGSSNGTLVNGARVRSVPLASGDIIELGSEKLTFMMPAASTWGRLIRRGAIGILGTAVAGIGLVLVLRSGESDSPSATQPSPTVAVVPAPAPSAAQPATAAVPAALVSEPSAASAPGAAAAPLEALVPLTGGAASLYDAALAYIKGGKLVEARRLLRGASDQAPGDSTIAQRLREVEATIEARVEHHLAAGQQAFSFLRYREAMLQWQQVIALSEPDDPRHQEALAAIERAQAKLTAR